MGRWVIALIGVAALVVAPSASPQIVVARTVFHTAGLPSNAVTSFTVACPPGYLAASGGVSTAPSGVTTLGIRPLGLGTYAFRFGNPATNPRKRVTVTVACRRIRVAGGTSPYLKLKPLKLKPLKVKPSTEKAAALSCPSGFVPAGTGFGFSGATLSIVRQTQTLHGVTFRVRNTGSRARSVALFASCLTVVRRRGASNERLLVRLVSDSTPIRPGSQIVKRSCPRRWMALATGFGLPRSLTMEGSVALAAAGKWSVTNRSDSDALAGLELVCARLG